MSANLVGVSGSTSDRFCGKMRPVERSMLRRKNVIEILQQLAHQQRYCVVVVTHNLEIAERSDKVWSMSDGVLVEQVVQPV